MNIRIIQRLTEIDPTDWNRLCPDNQPFIRHEFLSALEEAGCVNVQFGWQPCHILVQDGARLIGAMPVYLKHYNYGEFVFDQVWEEFYQRHQVNYYPKLVTAIPYTPVTGARILCENGDLERVITIIHKVLPTLAQQWKVSSWHGLFVTESLAQSMNVIERHDCQYHWYNRGYTSFDEFLLALQRKKRKNIRYERKAVAEQGIGFRILSGTEARAKDWEDFSQFYQHTFSEKGGMATLNQTFFMQIARAMPDQVVLILADKDEQCIAGALCYRDDQVLYGRHWGCCEAYEFLHFETCYYQGIDYCIREGLSRFEPGAQGEHKIARGFVPTLTRSLHWLADARFVPPIDDFARRERAHIQHYMEAIESPYATKT
jgi:uncharacterized protein